jgi:DNA repair exonuclease SbcCD nuclease subunit
MTCNGDDRRIFVASDLHIAERPIASIPGLCGDAYYAFDQIARSSSHHKLIVAGDFFNNVPPSSLDCVLVRSLYERYSFRLFYVLGQHDGKASPDWVATVVPQAGHISQSDLVHSGYLIGGLDYQPPDRFLESYYYKVASANYDILVIHQSFREFLPWSDISISQLFFPDNAPFLDHFRRFSQAVPL